MPQGTITKCPYKVEIVEFNCTPDYGNKLLKTLGLEDVRKVIELKLKVSSRKVKVSITRPMNLEGIPHYE